METNTALLTIITVLLTIIVVLITVFMYMVKALRDEQKSTNAIVIQLVTDQAVLRTEHDMLTGHGKHNCNDEHSNND
jgi:uncharacterized protein YpmB